MFDDNFKTQKLIEEIYENNYVILKVHSCKNGDTLLNDGFHITLVSRSDVSAEYQIDGESLLDCLTGATQLFEESQIITVDDKNGESNVTE